MRDFLYILLFRFFAFVVKITPTLLLSKLIKALAIFAYIVDKKHRRIAEVNLDFAYNKTLSEADKKEIIILAYENILKNAISVASDMTPEEMLSKFEYVNIGVVKKLIDDGTKIIFITAHYGNWEVLIKALAAKTGLKIVAVGRELDSKVMDMVIKNSRERFGAELISKHGAMRKLVKALKDGKSAGILVDQNTAEDEGLLISFFGKEARQTPVASILARRFRAAIVPVFCENIELDRYKLIFYEPIYCPLTDDVDADILSCTQAQSDALEVQIRKNPGLWFWFHKRWKNRYEEIYR